MSDQAERLTDGPIKVQTLPVGATLEIAGEGGEKLSMILQRPGDEKTLPLLLLDPEKTTPEVRAKLSVQLRQGGPTEIKLTGTSIEDNDRLSVDDPEVCRAEILPNRHLLIRFFDPRGGWRQVIPFRVADAVVLAA